MRVNVNQIKEMKQKGEKISMLTAYDYSTARILDEVGIPLILAGDSLGMVVLGYESTIPVTIDEMLHHTKAVVRGTKQAMVIGDMSFMSYHLSVEQALKNAARFIQEAGAQAVKLEGGVTVAEKIRRVVECGIPVMGHIG
ncbi:3-methyl-2-oxobutanoate hydroxymethyltransferase, partial [Chloroflexota bacterium]